MAVTTITFIYATTPCEHVYFSCSAIKSRENCRSRLSIFHFSMSVHYRCAINTERLPLYTAFNYISSAIHAYRLRRIFLYAVSIVFHTDSASVHLALSDNTVGNVNRARTVFKRAAYLTDSYQHRIPPNTANDRK